MPSHKGRRGSGRGRGRGRCRSQARRNQQEGIIRFVPLVTIAPSLHRSTSSACGQPQGLREVPYSAGTVTVRRSKRVCVGVACRRAVCPDDRRGAPCRNGVGTVVQRQSCPADGSLPCASAMLLIPVAAAGHRRHLSACSGWSRELCGSGLSQFRPAAAYSACCPIQSYRQRPEKWSHGQSDHLKQSHLPIVQEALSPPFPHDSHAARSARGGAPGVGEEGGGWGVG